MKLNLASVMAVLFDGFVRKPTTLESAAAVAARSVRVRWHIAASLMTLCFVGSIMARSQPPAPAPGKPAQENQHKTAPNNAKTESEQQAPALDSSGPDKGHSTLATSRPKDKGNNRGDEPPRDWWAIIASGLNLFFTGCLVGLMYLQWRSMQDQARHMRDGLVETRKASDAATVSAAAAKVSADGTVDSNRIAKNALIYGRRSWLIPEVDEGSPFKEGAAWKVGFYISNTGSVPGVMINAHTRMGTDPEFGTAPPQMLSPRGAIVLPGSGKEGALRVTADVPTDIPEDQLLAATGSHLCIYCAITYKDIISDELETGERETRVSWIHGHGKLWYNNPYFEIVLT